MLALVDGDVLLHNCLWFSDDLDKFRAEASRTIKDWTDSAFCDDFVVALGSRDGSNFRQDVFEGYKMSKARDNSRKIRKDFLGEAWGLISAHPNTSVADYVEADDLLGHWGTALREDSVIVSIDKDLLQVPGVHFNPRRGYSRVSEEEANLFFMKQMVMGDSIDNIPGIRQMGPKKTEAVFSGLNYKESVSALLSIYQDTFKEEWVDYFLSNGKLLFIQREPNQFFSLDLFRELFDASELM